VHQSVGQEIKNNVKALYKKGVAYGSMRDNEKAIADLKIVDVLFSF